MPFFSRSDRPDSGPRHRRGDRDDGARPSFDVESFEFVSAGGDVGLLRLSGVFSADPGQVIELPIEIEIERDGKSVRLGAVPDPLAPDAIALPGGEEWHGGFMADVELAEDPRADFALVAGGEVIAGLPRPGEEAATGGRDVLPELLAALDEVAAMEAEEEPPPAVTEAARERTARAEAEAALAELEAEVERHRETHAAAESARTKLLAASDQERARHQAAEAELRRELEEARRELEATAAEVVHARAALAGSNADRDTELHDLRAELDDSRRLIEEQGAALEELRTQLENERGAVAEAAERAAERASGETGQKLSAVHEHLEQARAELDLERRRRVTIEEELRVQIGLERQLRASLAGQEAEIAASEAHVARRLRAAERRRDAERTGEPTQVDTEDFFERVEQAKRLSENSV
jgi:hypothetical protein